MRDIMLPWACCCPLRSMAANCAIWLNISRAICSAPSMSPSRSFWRICSIIERMSEKGMLRMDDGLTNSLGICRANCESEAWSS